ncbi:MAG: ribosome biogenesis GTPase Der, partial [Clostridiales bacterium]|nr:ribosome biogenesis GTPase Der [Clostridiales bacterium]
VMRALAAVRRADVAVLVCDANEGMTEQDVKIAGYIHDEGKPAIIALNKWDIVEKDEKTAERLKAKVLEELKFMDYVTPIFISAKTGKRVDVVLKESRRVYANASRRIPTGLLNEVLMDAVRIVEPPSKNGRRLKMLYSTQVAVNPPTFVVKVNEPELMHFSYRRYLENALRKSFDFSGTPIKILSRKNDEE